MERRIALFALAGMFLGAIAGAGFGAGSGNALPGMGFGALCGAGLGWFIAAAVTERSGK